MHLAPWPSASFALSALALVGGGSVVVPAASAALPAAADGVHHDGDGSREGWFHLPGGSAGYTEPIGTQAWMPLNNHPTAKALRAILGGQRFIQTLSTSSGCTGDRASPRDKSRPGSISSCRCSPRRATRDSIGSSGSGSTPAIRPVVASTDP